MHPYTPLLIYCIVALAVPIVISILAARLGRVENPPDSVKFLPYESGHPTEALVGRFPVKFYLVAMLFVVFDVETVAFFPWAVTLRELGAWGFYAMVPFLLIFVLGDLYVWKKGGFEWK